MEAASFLVALFVVLLVLLAVPVASTWRRLVGFGPRTTTAARLRCGLCPVGDQCAAGKSAGASRPADCPSAPLR